MLCAYPREGDLGRVAFLPSTDSRAAPGRLRFSLQNLLNELAGWGEGVGIFTHILGLFFRILAPFFDSINTVRQDLSLSTIFDSFSCVKHISMHYFVVHNLPSQPSGPGLPPCTLHPRVRHIMNDYSFRQRSWKLVVSKATGHPGVGCWGGGLAQPGGDWE